jgi:hypothetical protein
MTLSPRWPWDRLAVPIAARLDRFGQSRLGVYVRRRRSWSRRRHTVFMDSKDSLLVTVPHRIDAHQKANAAQHTPTAALTALVLTGLLAVGLGGAFVTPVVNLDLLSYPAAASGRPGALPREVEIPPARMVGPELYPSVVIPQWELDFICTPGGWRRVHGAVVIFWGRAIGSSKPPAKGQPPHSC